MITVQKDFSLPETYPLTRIALPEVARCFLSSLLGATSAREASTSPVHSQRRVSTARQVDAARKSMVSLFFLLCVFAPSCPSSPLPGCLPASV